MGTQFTSRVSRSSRVSAAIARRIGESYQEFKTRGASKAGADARFSRMLGDKVVSAIFAESNALNFAGSLATSEMFTAVLRFLRNLRSDAEFKNLQVTLGSDPDAEPSLEVPRLIGDLTKPPVEGTPDDPFRVVAAQAGKLVLVRLALAASVLDPALAPRDRYAQALRKTSIAEITARYVGAFVSSYSDDMLKSIDPNQQKFTHGDLMKGIEKESARRARRIRDEIVAQGALTDDPKIRSITASILAEAA